MAISVWPLSKNAPHGRVHHHLFLLDQMRQCHCAFRRRKTLPGVVVSLFAKTNFGMVAVLGVLLVAEIAPHLDIEPI